MVCGLDLVEWMIRIAAGEKLTFSQAEVRLDGWAIEARIYAEDPVRDFLPAVGRLVRYRPPAESANVRVDTGVQEGDGISIHYDPHDRQADRPGRHPRRRHRAHARGRWMRSSSAGSPTTSPFWPR